MSDKTSPVFIIGTERSGTNLLRLILNTHSRIAVPHPPHILRNFFNLAPLYGDLSDDRAFKCLIDDVVRSVELHPYPWGVAIDKSQIFESARERNLVNIYFAIYDQYRQACGKKRWGCKSTFMIDHVALVRHYYPYAKFIYMVRDGRDVAASAQGTIFNHYSVFYAAHRWRREQQTGMYWLQRLKKEEIFLLRYEDLVKDPEAAVETLCAFLGEMYEEPMLRFFQTEEAHKSATLSEAWRNTSRPIMRENTGRYQTALSRREIELFEAIAGLELDSFSYPLGLPLHVCESWRARGIPFRVSYWLTERWRSVCVQARYFFSDKSTRLRLEKYWFLKLLWLRRFFLWR